MTDGSPTLRNLLQGLDGGRALDQSSFARIEDRLRQSDAEGSTPWFLQPFIFAGAFIAAVMISIGIASLFQFRLDSPALLIIGGVYILLGIAFHITSTISFVHHLGFACSIGGHAFFLIGIADLVEGERDAMAVFATAAVLCVLLYKIYGDFLHRLFSCLLVFAVAKLALPDAGMEEALHAVVAIAAATCAYLLTRPVDNPMWRPLAYACGIGLVGILLPFSERGLWFEDSELPHRYISSVACGIALLWALQFASIRASGSINSKQGLLAVLLVAAIASLSTPGIPAALFLVVLGHATLHWPITAIGLVGLPIFVWKYYYNLELDFVTKSGILAGSGILLLLARWLVTRLGQGITEENPHAAS